MNNVDNNLEKIAHFLEAVRPMQITERFPKKPDGTRENDAEHSWALCMSILAMETELKKEFGPDINIERMLKLALVHDLGEVDPGDIPTWEKAEKQDQASLERACVQRLASILPLPAAKTIADLWEECEAKETLEAKIVKSLDRLDPVIHRVAFSQGWAGGPYSDLAELDSIQMERHSFSETLVELYEIMRAKILSRNLLQRKY